MLVIAGTTSVAQAKPLPVVLQIAEAELHIGHTRHPLTLIHRLLPVRQTSIGMVPVA